MKCTGVSAGLHKTPRVGLGENKGKTTATQGTLTGLLSMLFRLFRPFLI